MKFSKRIAGFAALAFLGLAPNAYAAKVFTVSGTIAPDQYGNGYVSYGQVLHPADPYQPLFFNGARVSFSHTVDGGMAVHSTGGTGRVLDKDGNELYGFNMDLWDSIDLSGARQGRVRYSIPSASDYFSWYSRGDVARIDLSSLSSPVDYRLSLFAGVPEPATWALMIVGFGGIGATMRRRMTRGAALNY